MLVTEWNDINECNDKSKFHCDGNCINTPGSYSCTCRPGYTGNATTPNGCQRDKGSNFPVMIFTLDKRQAKRIEGHLFNVEKFIKSNEFVRYVPNAHDFEHWSCISFRESSMAALFQDVFWLLLP
ncbi:EGF-like domain-containing protein [Artemisia annua]|uniref:EGF-like domain-containing protein n=1 Tax=Artemisia annua TaxID=35608 RepID=A0A2U1NHT3_ARTAN|nr:EGF-like domain-containing protein [Artemisia annua]